VISYTGSTPESVAESSHAIEIAQGIDHKPFGIRPRAHGCGRYFPFLVGKLLHHHLNPKLPSYAKGNGQSNFVIQGSWQGSRFCEVRECAKSSRC
jgi:hypothetical protein